MDAVGFKRLIKQFVQESLNEFQRRICSWCGKDIGTNNSDQVGPEFDSHGICPECKAKIIANITKSTPKDAPSPIPPHPPGIP